MKTYLLWDRFLSFWLPPERVTGDAERDIGEALRGSYDLPDGKRATFAQKGGLSTSVVTEEATVVASRIPPHGGSPARPDWLDWRGALAGKDQRALLDRTIRDLLARPRPHIVLRTGKRPFEAREIVVGDGTGAVVNEPGKATIVADAVRVARARRALESLGSANRALQAVKLLRARETAGQETAAIDDEIRKSITRLKIDSAAFFDALDLLEGVSRRELELAEESR